MAPLGNFWTRVVCVFDYWMGSPQPLPLFDTRPELQIPVPAPEPTVAAKYPIWNPPDDLEKVPFRCEYPNYPESDGWVSCNTNTDRKCWLKNNKTGKRFDISTNYELEGPKGIIREYYLELSETVKNPDGAADVFVQLFNGSFPGPRLQACWGDQIRITINNTLTTKGPDHPGNGTTIHWHGFRQWKTSAMDGVNAVTQCPIPPGTAFTYVFNATQYGSSWYHSHYSLQYAAGALGPFTVYGPASLEFDHQVTPIIISDWLHMSPFTRWEQSLTDPENKPILFDNMLQNGIGQWPLRSESNPYPPGTKFNEVFFQKGVKYLMRLINGAADTTFVFSIDNHMFNVISTDFVAIKPYLTDNVVIGIGQRYNIIVTAIPTTFTNDVNFWIRTSPSQNCENFKQPKPDGRTGIIRYTANKNMPTTSRQKFNLTCADETYFRELKPIVPWAISPARQKLPDFYLSINGTIKGAPYFPCNKAGGRFQLVQDHPMWLNFSDPPLLHPSQDFSKKPWLTVVNTGKVSEDTWIQINILSGAKRPDEPKKPHPIPRLPGIFTPPQHPIHLHGHDFAVLDQCVPGEGERCDLNKANLRLDNPARRDVAFLPRGGYLIIAFKADNPGAWIMHCHIAFHASMGLAAQILENVDLWPKTFGFGWDEPFLDMCRKWDNTGLMDSSDPCQLLNPKVLPLQTDSGI